MVQVTGSAKDRTGVQVIGRAAGILRVLKDDTSGMSLGQIAERVDLPRSTVQRIVGALQSEGFITSDSGAGGLRLGPELSVLAAVTRYNTVEECRPALTALSQQTGETTDLSVLRNSGMVFLDQIAGTHRLRTVSAVGDVFPLTSTANGRACLALMDEAEARRIIQEEWAQRGIGGHLEAYMNMLVDIRRSGLAYDLEEHAQGISAIGFAFRDWSGALHAISVPIPSSRFETNREKVELAIGHTKAQVQKMMSPTG